MPTFPCPHCPSAITVDADCAGTVVRCPACKGTSAVPQWQPADPAAGEPETEPRAGVVIVSVRRTRGLAGWWGWGASASGFVTLGLFFLPFVQIAALGFGSQLTLYGSQSGFQAACGRKSQPPERGASPYLSGPEVTDDN